MIYIQSSALVHFHKLNTLYVTATQIFKKVLSDPKNALYFTHFIHYPPQK